MVLLRVPRDMPFFLFLGGAYLNALKGSPEVHSSFEGCELVIFTPPPPFFFLDYFFSDDIDARESGNLSIGETLMPFELQNSA